MKKRASRRDRETIARLITGTARVFLSLGFLCLAVCAVYYTRQALDAGKYFKLDKLEYRGVNHLDQASVTKLIRQASPEDLLAVDLERVRRIIEAEAWVKHAIVRRKLPGRLIIHISERRPAAIAAIDNALYVVDEEGVVLDSFGSDYQSIDRPIVKGLSSIARENAKQENKRRIQVYLNVIQDLGSGEKDYTRAIAEIDVGNPEKVVVFPADEPVPIYLGRDRFRKRYEAFLSQKEVYYRLKQIHGRIEYIDVSYENKVIFHTPKRVVTG